MQKDSKAGFIDLSPVLGSFAKKRKVKMKIRKMNGLKFKENLYCGLRENKVSKYKCKKLLSLNSYSVRKYDKKMSQYLTGKAFYCIDEALTGSYKDLIIEAINWELKKNKIFNNQRINNTREENIKWLFSHLKIMKKYMSLFIVKEIVKESTPEKKEAIKFFEKLEKEKVDIEQSYFKRLKKEYPSQPEDAAKAISKIYKKLILEGHLKELKRIDEILFSKDEKEFENKVIDAVNEADMILMGI